MYFLYVPSVISLFQHQKESLSEPPPHPPPRTKKKIKSGKHAAIGMLSTNDVMKLWQIISI